MTTAQGPIGLLFVGNKMREKHHFAASVIYMDVALADNASNVCNVRPIATQFFVSTLNRVRRAFHSPLHIVIFWQLLRWATVIRRSKLNRWW